MAYNPRAYKWTEKEKKIVLENYERYGALYIVENFLPHLNKNIVGNLARKHGLSISPKVKAEINSRAQNKYRKKNKFSYGGILDDEGVKFVMKYVTLPTFSDLIGTRYYGQ